MSRPKDLDRHERRVVFIALVRFIHHQISMRRRIRRKFGDDVWDDRIQQTIDSEAAARSAYLKLGGIPRIINHEEADDAREA